MSSERVSSERVTAAPVGLAVGRPRDPALERKALNAARDLLAERGYRGVSYDEVARRAGVCKSSLYLRWPAKAD